MNEEQIATVKLTWAQVVPIADTAADLFYGRLFELDESLRPLFSEDLSEQKKKLLQTLGAVVGALDNVESIVPDVQDLGRRHVGYGVEESHYQTVGAALLWTLEKGLGDAWDPEVQDAWTAAYTLLSTVMIAAARTVEAAE